MTFEGAADMRWPESRLVEAVGPLTEVDLHDTMFETFGNPF
jgi:hypothetical protein